ncbi:bromodomain-containing protein 7 [Halyomorpha halys]|uniref:bromodomain-containing protein 7 n=1 Tax=Halyomorpha halys TaxID=286706 RepID=UPI0006D4E93D|nr:bromodomain-containing protein 7-like [Halyomorpha halys]
MGSSKKHKKHKKDKYEDKGLIGEKPPALKLILKVGSSSTPEHSDSPGPHIQTSSYTVTPDDESLQSSSSFHKKSKKKKKKKDRDHDRHERKKRHHHKEKRRHNYDESSQDNISLIEESSTETPVQLKDTVVKHIEDPPSPDSAVNREARLCVQLLRQKQNRTPLQRLLDYLQQQLEKKDVKQVFAWPVTDQIAPGYSQTITQPMDFSTMRQKIDDNAYCNLNAYISDLRLMCNNAMIYNRPDTMYYKAAKRLLHAGLKILSCEKLRQLAVTFPIINQVPSEQLGFVTGTGNTIDDQETNSNDILDENDKKENSDSPSPKRRHCNFVMENKFEAIPDDLSAEEILEIAQKSAKASAEKLSLKRPKTNMGFLRQKQDGSTSLAIFIPGNGLDSEQPQERPVSLGQLIGKLNHGTGQLQGFREDRRNIAKTVKPLNYGAFGSYAPSYDSTFANLSKEETDLIYETYGDENATIYAESVLNFARDCDYTLTMVDNLLDLLTGGEHRKAKNIIDEHRRFREEEERVKELMDIKSHSHVPTPSTKSDMSNLKIEIEQLKTLSEFGIDTSFLNEFEGLKDNTVVQEKLEHTTALLEKLQQVQNDRLSAAPPPHLSQILPPSETELHLAEKITESLTELAKQVPPGAIIPVPAIRKAMGIVPETTLVSTATNTVLPLNNSVDGVVSLEGGESSGEEEPCVGVGVDFESELREFLESDTALSGFPLHDDKTIEEMLSES